MNISSAFILENTSIPGKCAQRSSLPNPGQRLCLVVEVRVAAILREIRVGQGAPGTVEWVSITVLLG